MAASRAVELTAWVTPAPEKPATAKPEALYQQHCATCHGTQRTGAMGPALLPEGLARLRLEPGDCLLGLFDERIPFGTRRYVQPPEPLHELTENLNGRIPEDLGLAVVKPS